MRNPACRAVNLGLRFGLELCALGALGYWGSRAGDGAVAGAVLAIGTPLVAAIAWGLFVSPRARVSLPIAGRLAVELVVFGSAALALYANAHLVLAAALASGAAVNLALIHLWRQDERDQA